MSKKMIKRPGDPPRAEVQGRLQMSFIEARITRNGKTEVIREFSINRKLVNGEWVDVTPRRLPTKKVQSKVLKERK